MKVLHPCRNTRFGAGRGTALLVVIFTVSLLSLVAATVLHSINAKHAAVYQASSWQESLSGAEAGVAYALTALRRHLLEGDSAWNDWRDESTTDEFKKSYPPSGRITLSHLGEGNNHIRFSVTVSAPIGPGTLNPASASTKDPKNYYKIRALGSADLSGPQRLSPYKSDIALRRLSWLVDFRTGLKPIRPESVRIVEAVAKPLTPFSTALLAQEKLEILKGQGQIIDSYNSEKGNYDPANRRSFGNIATNGKTNHFVKLENVTVYGDVAKQDGTVTIGSSATVKGEIINDFYRELKPVLSPRFDPSFAPITTLPVDADHRAVELTGAADPNSPMRYKLNKIHLHAGEKLTIKPHLPGETSYLQIWVPGDVLIHKGGQIEIQAGAEPTFFVESNVTFEENNGRTAIKNFNSKPETLSIYGVRPDNDKAKFKLKNEFVGVVYAPKHEFEINLKAGRHIYGALVGRRFRVEGRTQIHYDESLEDKGKPTDYTLVSWMEEWYSTAARAL